MAPVTATLRSRQNELVPACAAVTAVTIEGATVAGASRPSQGDGPVADARRDEAGRLPVAPHEEHGAVQDPDRCRIAGPSGEPHDPGGPDDREDGEHPAPPREEQRRDHEEAEEHEQVGPLDQPRPGEAEAAAVVEGRQLHDPGDATAHQWYAEYLSIVGRDIEARREAEQAVALDPLSPIIRVDQALALVRGRHLEEAIGLLRRVLETTPDFPPAHNTLGWAYAAAGRLEEAVAEQETTVRVSRGRGGQGRLAHSYGRLGRTDTAMALTQSMIERFHREQIFPYPVALGYAGMGDHDQALDWLERAVQLHDPNVALYLRSDPLLDSLRNHPRFRRLLRRVGLE